MIVRGASDKRVQRSVARHIVFACLALASCAKPGNNEGQVLSTTIEPQTGIAQAIRVSIPSVFVKNNSAPDFFIKNQAGDVTAWDPTHLAVSNKDAVIDLQSSATTYRPKVNDSILIYFVEKGSGAQHTLPLSTLRVPSSEAIIDPGFIAWTTSTSPLVPVGWSPLADAKTKFAILPLNGSKGGVRLVITPSGVRPGRIETIALRQDVRLRNGRLRVKMRPHQNCQTAPASQGGNVISAAGAALSGASGAEVLFCVTSARQRGVREMPGGSPVIIMIPGKVNAWNDVILDVRDAAPYVRLRTMKEGRLELQLIVAVDSARNGMPPSVVDFQSVDPNP